MANEKIETSKTPQIEVTDCAGDLVIRPWMELAVKAQGPYQMDEVESCLVFSSQGDLRLLVPEGATLRLGNVRGDLMIKGVRGDISLNEISGDAVLLNLTQVKAGNIQGDLAAKNSEGPLYVEAIYGDAIMRNIDSDVSIGSIYGDFAAYYVSGNVRLGQCMGDINLRTINGEVSIDTGHRDANLRNLGSLCLIKDIHGDIRLKGGLSAGKHSFEALGDIVVRWPGNAPLQVVAKAADIRNRLPLEDVKEIDDTLVGRIGNGDTIVNLRAGGRIVLKEGQLIDEKWESEHKEAFDMDFMIDLADLGERISAEVHHSMARMTGEIETHFGPEFAQNISTKVSQQAEKAAQKAEAAAEKARMYAEREVARAERAQQRRAAQYAPPPKRSPRPDVPHAKASTEEQLKILRMVEKGTISPDEASTLLEALEH
jgi:hypothetical protein